MSEHTRSSGVAGPSRRQFLARSASLAAGGIAAGALLPDDLFAAADAPVGRALPRPALGSDEPVRIGVIGTGGMGTEHCNAILRLVEAEQTNARIVGLCDVCTPRLLEAFVKVRDAQPRDAEITMYTDYRKLLADPTIHGVLIATPEHWHAKMSEDALLAGKDVFVEKPMTFDLSDALRLRRVVHGNPEARLVVGTQYVMVPSYREARRLIAENAIGTPVFSQTSYCRNSKDGEWLYDVDPEWEPGENLGWDQWTGPRGRQPWDPEVYARWRRYRRYSTGIIGDLLVHRMTPLMQTLDAGWPVRVTATGGHLVDKAMENHDHVNITIEFESGHIMAVVGSTANEVGLETMIRGHRANLYLGGRNLTLRPERIYAEEIDEQTIEGEDLGGPQDRLRMHWIEIIRTREAPLSDIELGTQVMVAVDLASRSVWEGKAFRFEPDRLRTRGI